MIKFVLIYLVIVNILGIIIMLVDKEKAKNNQWRIKESTLFLVSIIGGSLGTLIGMNVFRHKTKHAQFVIGFPLILIIHIAIAVFVYFKFLKA